MNVRQLKQFCRGFRGATETLWKMMRESPPAQALQADGLDVVILDLSMPGGLKLSTGVLVLFADEESFTLMTPEGHMFAGWITFSSFVEDGETFAQAQVLMRASDPLYELGMTLGGHRQEDAHWLHTLASLAEHFGLTTEVSAQTICVDRKRQWSRAGNVWHNAGIRSGIHMAGAPIRTLRRLTQRGREA